MSGASARGRRVCVDLDAAGVSIVEGVVGPVPRVRRVHTATPPPGVLEGSAEGVGAWLREAMREGGVRPAPLVLSVPRLEAVLKAIELPPATLDDREIGALVRIQLTRQTALAAEACVVDHLPPGDGDGGGFVLAGAVAESRMAWRRAVAAEVGVPLAGAVLRASAALAACSASGVGEGVATLIVLLGAGAVEIVLADALGRPVLARGLDIARPGAGQDPQAYAERVSVEASRTAVSARVAQVGATEPAAVVVLGGGAEAGAVAEACAAALELPAGAGGPLDGRVAGLSAIDEGRRDAAAGAIGLLLAASSPARSLNFASPRRPADRGARRRQGVLGGVLAAVLVCGAGWLAASDHVASVRRGVGPLEAEARDLIARYTAQRIEAGALRYMEAWRTPRVDWLEHLERFTTEIDPPPAVVLDGVQGRLEATVGFKAGGEIASAGDWQPRWVGKFRVEGVAASRETVQGVRGRWIGSGAYEVTPRGPEVSGAFELDLSTPAEPVGAGR